MVYQERTRKIESERWRKDAFDTQRWYALMERKEEEE